MTSRSDKKPAKAGFRGEILTTRSLILRPLEKADAKDVAALANNYNVASMLDTMPYPYFDTDAQEFIKKMSAPKNDDCTYAITSAKTAALLGICSLHASSKIYRMPYIGYWLGEAHWGKGYATEAARALVDLFFKAGSEDQLLISVLTSNAASRRVIEKCGGQYWKQDTQYSAFFGEDRPVDHYRITRESWMGAVAA